MNCTIANDYDVIIGSYIKVYIILKSNHLEKDLQLEKKKKHREQGKYLVHFC